MARGFLGGAIVGTIVSGLGIGTASILTDIPGAAAPQAVALDVPAGSAFDAAREDTATDLPSVEDQPEAAPAPAVDAPDADDTAPQADTASAAQPETGTAQGVLSAPEATTGDGAVAVEGDAPVLPNPQAMAPTAPVAEDDLSISTDPAQPLAPPAEDSAFPDEMPAPAPLMPAEETAEMAPVPSADTTEEVALLPDPDTPAATPAPAPEPEAAPTPAPEPEPAPEEPEPTPEEPKEQEPAETPETPEGSERDADDPGAGVIGNLAPEVKTNRLPSVGTTDAADAPADATPAESRPITQFAVSFDNPDGKPLMAIVLIDDGSSQIGLDALQSFPYPLSFAVDAAAPGAADIMARYRAAGFEVLAMLDMPLGANGTDTEVAMQAALSVIPEAVAVLEGTDTGLQQSRNVSDQLAPILGASGHGLVMQPKGLNTAQKLIAKEGVPSATVFRDFDSKGQTATVIRRFLDQAAFKAGQEEKGVIMLGRLRPDTVSALLLWGLQDRASRVALAPVSAVLTNAP